jgi:hypothetical protein
LLRRVARSGRGLGIGRAGRRRSGPWTSASSGSAAPTSTARRKSPSPLFLNSSSSVILSSLIGSSVLVGWPSQIHRSRTFPVTTFAHARAGLYRIGHSTRRALTAEFPPRVRTLTNRPRLLFRVRGGLGGLFPASVLAGRIRLCRRGWPSIRSFHLGSGRSRKAHREPSYTCRSAISKASHMEGCSLTLVL